MCIPMHSQILIYINTLLSKSKGGGHFLLQELTQYKHSIWRQKLLCWFTPLPTPTFNLFPTSMKYDHLSTFVTFNKDQTKITKLSAHHNDPHPTSIACDCIPAFWWRWQNLFYLLYQCIWIGPCTRYYLYIWKHEETKLQWTHFIS